MDPKLFPVLMVFLAILALLTWVGFAAVRVQRTAAERLAVYGRAASNSREEAIREQGFADRAFAPVVLGLGRIARRFTPVGYLENVQKKMIYAGNPGNIDATSFVLLKVILASLGVIAAWAIRDSAEGMLRLLVIFGPPLVGFFGPDAWLQRHIDERKKSMLKALARTPSTSW
jgi:tight adherence protein C